MVRWYLLDYVMIRNPRGAKLCVVKKKVQRIEDMVHSAINAPIITRELENLPYVPGLACVLILS